MMPNYQLEVFDGNEAKKEVYGGVQARGSEARTTPLPEFNWPAAVNRRFAFVGFLNKYAISSRALKSSSESITTDCSPLRVMIRVSWSLHTLSIVLARFARAAE